MSEERFSVDLQISSENFMACGWKDILSNASREGYSSIWQAYSSGARKAVEENQQAHGNAIARAMRIPAAVDLEVAVSFGEGFKMIFGQKKTSSEKCLRRSVR